MGDQNLKKSKGEKAKKESIDDQAVALATLQAVLPLDQDRKNPQNSLPSIENI